DQAVRDPRQRGSYLGRSGAAEQRLLQSRNSSRRADFSEEVDSPGGARVGTKGDFEGSAESPLESQAGGARAEHQLPRVAVQDSRCGVAFQPDCEATATAGQGRNSQAGDCGRLIPV